MQQWKMSSKYERIGFYKLYNPLHATMENE